MFDWAKGVLGPPEALARLRNAVTKSVRDPTPEGAMGFSLGFEIVDLQPLIKSAASDADPLIYLRPVTIPYVFRNFPGGLQADPGRLPPVFAGADREYCEARAQIRRNPGYEQKPSSPDPIASLPLPVQTSVVRIESLPRCLAIATGQTIAQKVKEGMDAVEREIYIKQIDDLRYEVESLKREVEALKVAVGKAPQ